MNESETIDYRETKSAVERKLCNSSYGAGKDAIRGALDAVMEWAGKNSEELYGIMNRSFGEIMAEAREKKRMEDEGEAGA